jgi:hypothetical protein
MCDKTIMAKLLGNFGKVQEGAPSFICAWLKMVLTISLLTFLWERPSAGADWIEAMARGLSAGDGINFQAIPRSFSSDAPHFIASTQQGINFPNTTWVSNPIEANGPTDLSPTFTHAYRTNSGLSLTGPLQFQLAADMIRTGLYRDLERDRFVIANHRLTRRWKLGMIVPLSFGPWSSWPGATGGMAQAGMGDSIFSYTGPFRFQLKTDASGTDLLRLWSSGPEAMGGMAQAGMGDSIFSYTGPFRFQLKTDASGTDLYLDFGQDRFLFANHHLTRNWDLGMIVPLFFEPWPSWPGITGGMEEAGPGDIILQTEYKFPRKQLWWPDVMLRGQVKLPMGKVGFWGTGETDFNAFLIVSKNFGPLTPHVDLGVRWTTEGSKQNALSYVAGLYAQVHPSMTLILDVLGRWKPYGDGTGDHTINLDVLGRWKPYGDGTGNHTINLALGANWYAYRGFLLNSYILLPMTKPGGYRTDVTGTIRVEYLF